DDCGALAAALAPRVGLCALAPRARAAAEGWPTDRWREPLHAVRHAAAPAPLVLVVPPDLDEAKADELIEPLLAGGPGGVAVAGGGGGGGGGPALGRRGRGGGDGEGRRRGRPRGAR